MCVLAQHVNGLARSTAFRIALDFRVRWLMFLYSAARFLTPSALVNAMVNSLALGDLHFARHICLVSCINQIGCKMCLTMVRLCIYEICCDCSIPFEAHSARSSSHSCDVYGTHLHVSCVASEHGGTSDHPSVDGHGICTGSGVSGVARIRCCSGGCQ